MSHKYRRRIITIKCFTSKVMIEVNCSMLTHLLTRCIKITLWTIKIKPLAIFCYNFHLIYLEKCMIKRTYIIFTSLCRNTNEIICDAPKLITSMTQRRKTMLPIAPNVFCVMGCCNVYRRCGMLDYLIETELSAVLICTQSTITWKPHTRRLFGL